MPTEAPKRRALWIAALFGSGILLSRYAPDVHPLVWFLAALALLCIGILPRPRAALVALSLATVLVGGGWCTLRTRYSAPDHVARFLSDRPSLLAVEGMILDAPRMTTDRAGKLGRFFPGSPRTSFRLRVERRFLDGDESARTTGILWVAVEGDATRWNAGDRVRAVGMARAIDKPRNPGEADRRPWAVAQGIGGRLEIDSPGAVTLAASLSTPLAKLESVARRSIEGMRSSARRWLEADPAGSESDRRSRALLRALLLGTSDRDMEALESAFTRLGLTHILSISGLNLTILAGAMFWLLRLLGDRPRIEAFIGAAAIVGYLLIIPVRAPVSRSAIMILSLLAGESAGRRYDRLTILGWSMVIVLLIQPLELFSPGFQLSFGVVAALMTLAQPFRNFIFGERPQRDSHGPSRAILETLKDAAASAVVAWAIASPLVLYHVGVISPFGGAATVLLMPLVALIMGLGYIMLLATVVAPVIGEWGGPALAAAADLLARLVMLIDAAPISSITLPRCSLAWTALATFVIIWWLRPGGRTGIEGYSPLARRARWACTLAACAWMGATLMWPSLPRSQRMRLDTLDVGDGACHLLRSRAGGWREEAVMFDCGSLRLTVGERTIPAAVRALGGWHVSTIFISHPNVDHYAGLLDVVQPLNVRRVVISETFKEAADAAPGGAVAHVLNELSRLGVEIRIACEGDRFEIVGGHVEVLSPPRGATWKMDNDSSLVCRVVPDAMDQSILMTGDIQREAIVALRDRYPDLRPMLVEAPHHGSYNEAAIDFVRDTDPPYVVQSTGEQRLDDPRWAEVRNARAWHTTAEHGAATFIINSDGTVQAEYVRNAP